MVTNTQKGIIGLTLFTALVHLYLSISSSNQDNQLFFFLFALNFLGYIFLLGLIFLISGLYGSRTVFGILLMVYAGITILAYVVVNLQGDIANLISPLGIVTKIAELALIVLVYIDIRSYEHNEISIAE